MVRSRWLWLVLLLTACNVQPAGPMGPEIACNSANFSSTVLSNSLPVLVDFGATWCGPCQALQPVVGEIAHDYEHRLVVATVDIDESPDLAAKYAIRSIPALVLFRNGQELLRIEGAQSKTAIVAQLEPILH